MRVPTHDPQAAVGFEKQAVRSPCGNGCDAPVHNLLRAVGLGVSAIAQLAVIIFSHGPKTAIVLEKQSVLATSSHSRDSSSHDLFGTIGAIVCRIAISAVAQLARAVPALGLSGSVALEAQSIFLSCFNHGEDLRSPVFCWRRT